MGKNILHTINLLTNNNKNAISAAAVIGKKTPSEKPTIVVKSAASSSSSSDGVNKLSNILRYEEHLHQWRPKRGSLKLPDLSV